MKSCRLRGYLGPLAPLFLLLFVWTGPAAAQGRPGIVWMAGGHADAVTATVISPDGQTLVTGSQDGTMKFWRVSDGVLLHSVKAGSVNSISFSPDGNNIAVGSYGATFHLYRSSDGALVQKFTGHTGQVYSVAFSPDGQTIASGSADRTVRLWRVEDGSLVRTISGHPDAVTAVAFSNDGKTIASGGPSSNGEPIKLWRASDGLQTGDASLDSTAIYWLLFSPDGSRLICGSGAGLAFFRATGGVPLLKRPGPVYSLAYSPVWDVLATGYEGAPAKVKLWSGNGGRLLGTLSTGGYAVSSLAISPDGQYVASGGWDHDHRVKLWRISDLALVRTFTTHNDGIGSVAFSPDCQLLVSASGREFYDNALCFWRVADGALLRTSIAYVAGSWLTSVAFSPDGRTLATASIDDGQIRLIRASDGQRVGTLAGEDSQVTSVAYSPDGTMLATGGGRSVELWDTAANKRIRTLPGFGSVSFSPDSQLLAASSLGGISIWLTDGRLARSIASPSTAIVSFAPDGQTLASVGGSGARTVTLWRVSDGTALATMVGHSRRIRALCFSPDGQVLASAGDDGSIKLWSATCGSLLRSFDDVGWNVYCLAFSPDGSSMAYGCSDASVAVARSEPGSLPGGLLATGSRADGAFVVIGNLVVSAAFGGFFYAQDRMRSGGIRIVWDGAVEVGNELRVQGTLGTTADGERFIEASDVQVRDGAAPVPLDLALRSLGGEDLGSGQQGVANSLGLNNIGLLVRASGTVTAIDPSPVPTWFTVRDGSGFTVPDNGGEKWVEPAAPGGQAGVRVWAPALALPAVGDFVTVSGISSCYKANEDLYPLLRVREQADIVAVTAP